VISLSRYAHFCAPISKIHWLELRDYEIMNKIQIPERTFYHCNRVLAKQIEEFKSKL